MVDHAKCRVMNCGGTGRRFEDDCGASQIVCLKCGAAGPRRSNPKGPRRGRPLGSMKAWEGWDDLMRPAIPEPLRELVRAAKAWQSSGADEYEEVLDGAIDVLPPDILAACLKETK
jgi:hypothetical protein